MSWGSLITWPPMLLFFFQGPCLSIRLRFVLMLFHQTISTHGLNFVYFSPIAKLCWWEFFYLEVVNSLAIFRLGGRALAWKNSRHCSTPPHIDYASLPRTGIVTRHQNGIIIISTLVSLTSFRWETSSDVAKCWLIFQASREPVQKAGWFLFKLLERKRWKSSSLNGKSLSASQNNYNPKVRISPTETLQ